MSTEPDFRHSHTWQELRSQSHIWREWGKERDIESCRGWLKDHGPTEIWLSGAGSSAFIGDIIAAHEHCYGRSGIRSVPSTDIVGAPAMLSNPNLGAVVSFGRSGNSTETIGVPDALQVMAPQVAQLNITCNPNGALAKQSGALNQRVVCLPSETHDRGFTMTSSFSTMLLTCLAITSSEVHGDAFDRLAKIFDSVFNDFEQDTMAAPTPARLVFLGSGPLQFAAREAALKVMELTAGKIPTLWDSYLGFRHGPKSFVDDDTAFVCFRSANPHTQKYESDLLAELQGQFPGNRITTLGPEAEIGFGGSLQDAWMAPIHVCYAQILGVVLSSRFNLNIDDPFEGKGTLTRVVSGFRLHEISR